MPPAPPASLAAEEAFLQALRGFASGVTVVTASHAGAKVAVTVSAFASVSLAPPLILFCLKRSSSVVAAFEQGAAFCVHLLAQTQRSVAQQCASAQTRNWQQIPHHMDAATGIPLLAGSMAQLFCTVSTLYPGGDHVIIIGAVEKTLCADSHLSPLLYHARAYHGLAKLHD